MTSPADIIDAENKASSAMIERHRTQFSGIKATVKGFTEQIKSIPGPSKTNLSFLARILDKLETVEKQKAAVTPVLPSA